jgi:DNA-binding SARP family transcriptional activator
MLVTLAAGTLGGSLRFLPVVGDSEPWIGVSLVTLSMILAAYAIFASGIFFAADAAGRAFWTTMLLGIGLFLFVGVLIAVDTLSSRLLGLDVPLFTALSLVVAIAVYGPTAAWIRNRMAGRSPRVLARDRLLRALGQSGLTAQPADAGLGPALARIAEVLDLAGATVVAPDGTIVARERRTSAATGGPPSSIPLVAADEHVGELHLESTGAGHPLGPNDDDLLRLSAMYVAAAVRTGRLEEQQAEALAGLTVDRAFVDSTAARLHEALVLRSAGPVGLRVFALGPLRVERAGEPITRWGGEKAGTRQALGLFAFLFDRGERGVAKDEVLELIWPDADLDRADLAFHRTLAGLRHTLDPSGGGKRVIRFGNDRYRLDEAIVEWSDVDAFLADIDASRRTADAASTLALLGQARGHYRSEYLDDCPFYGDSVHVEERRETLRQRFAEVLLALGEAYEARDDRLSATAAYQDAIRLTHGDSPQAKKGLARLDSDD